MGTLVQTQPANYANAAGANAAGVNATGADTASTKPRTGATITSFSRKGTDFLGATSGINYQFSGEPSSRMLRSNQVVEKKKGAAKWT